MNPHRLRLSAILLGVAALCTPAFGAPGDIVLQGDHAVLPGGKKAGKTSVLLRDGRVAGVKDGHVNPWGGEVQRFEGGWLVPGFVEPHSQGGLDRGNEQATTTPFVSVLDGLDPLAEYFADLLREGVTTVFVVPGDRTLIGGQGLVLKPFGRTAEEMVVRGEAGMKIAIEPRPGTSRMAHLAELRRTLKSAQDQQGARRLSSPDDDPTDPRIAALATVLDGEQPAVLACGAPVDVLNAVRIRDEFGLTGFLTLGTATHRALPLIVEHGLPVVLPSNLEPLETDAETGDETRPMLARRFHQAGVPLVLDARENAPWGERTLWFQAATAVSQGVPREAAMRGITENPAALLGVADRVGSIEVGRDANVVVWTGDPLSATSWVDHVYLEGELVYDRDDDRRLARLRAGLDYVEPRDGAEEGAK